MSKHLLILSLDSLSQEDLDQLSKMPHFSQLLQEGTLVREVDSVFLTNTYTIHTSIITGCHPARHGIWDNLRKDPGNPEPPWHWHRKWIRTTTLYDEAAKKGLTVASLLWPVTAKAKIRWNFPEIFPHRKGQNQALLTLTNSSFWFALLGVLRHGKGLKGKHEPELDDFTVPFMEETILKRKPNLILHHLIDTDSQKHQYGIKDRHTKDSIKRMDHRIGRLVRSMKKLDKDYGLILFSDHGSLAVQETLDPNDILEDMGIQVPRSPGAPWEAWFRTCGGTAFLYLQPHRLDLADGIRKRFEDLIQETGNGYRRFLDPEEMRTSGFDQDSIFGIEGEVGTEFHNDGSRYKANHGYSLKNEGYKVFYFAKGPGIPEGKVIQGGSLLDVTPLAAKMLEIPPWDMDGTIQDKLNYKEGPKHG